MKCIICSSTLIGNQRKFCSASCKQKEHWQSFKERPNSMHSQTKRALERKLELIKLLGGKCSKCGYTKNYTALEFHHVDPAKKEMPLSGRHLSNSSKTRILNEVSKCILLCANCHREEEHPEATLIHGANGGAPD